MGINMISNCTLDRNIRKGLVVRRMARGAYGEIIIMRGRHNPAKLNGAISANVNNNKRRRAHLNAVPKPVEPAPPNVQLPDRTGTGGYSVTVIHPRLSSRKFHPGDIQHQPQRRFCGNSGSSVDGADQFLWSPWW